MINLARENYTCVTRYRHVGVFGESLDGFFAYSKFRHVLQQSSGQNPARDGEVDN
jgi:hypothetical protein